MKLTKEVFQNSKWFYVGLFILVFILISIRQRDFDNFHCEICADKAGYYMYLPAVFQWGFDSKNYPDGFDADHGYGFKIDRGNDKVITKFTYGVALLQLPFYATGFVIANVFDLNSSPYSYYYLFFINIGAAFYLVLGLYFIRKWLSKYVDSISSLLSTLLIFFGTNLFYYTLDESLMSHLYSFMLFSVFLFFLKSFFETEKPMSFFISVVALSIAVLIRPTNILFLFIAFFLDASSLAEIKRKVRLLLTLKNFVILTLVCFTIFFPQLLYWKYAFGDYIVWSYANEGFTLWNNPAFSIVWFSPQSGLFVYTPIIILSLIYALVMVLKKQYNAIVVVLSFLLVSYLCAAWHNSFFGECNFGKRPFIEYYPIIMLPIAYLLSVIKTYSIFIKYLIIAIIVFFVYYNIALVSVFNTCFFGGAWAWHEFVLLIKPIFGF